MASSSSIPPFGLFFKCFPVGCLHRLTFRSSKVPLIVILGVLSASSFGCEIYNTESLSPDCDDANKEIVNMDSMVTRNCSIKNGGTTLGKTWEQVSNMLNSKDGLVLETLNSSTRIYLTRPLEATHRPSSPRTLYSDEARKLSCRFKGWPIPRVVWYKDGKAVVNGTNGFYYTEKMSEDHQNTLEASLYIPSREENEGFYTCTANSSICDWSSKPKSQQIQVIYKCPFGIEAKDSKTLVAAIAFSNSTLSCLVYDPHDECDLKWFFNNKTLPSTSNDKYKIALQRETSSKCKKAFSLMVMNVTFVDKGTYSCMCEYETSQWSAPVKLNVYHATPVTSPPKTTYSESAVVQEQTEPMRGGSSRKWIFPVISISACGVFALITAVVVRYVKKKMVYKKIKRRAEEGVTNNKLFISYSSKDYSWVTENLLAFLDKHSIPYSIHTRDFELGKPIVQNMADSVYNSRQVLIVLSDNYLASNFCCEELHMAVQRGVHTEDSSLVLVLIDKFNKKRLPCALRNKALLNFEKHKRKKNWEEKLLRAIIGAKTVSSV